MALWTQEEMELAKVMARNGAHYATIGAKIGRSGNAVKNKLADMRLPPAPELKKSTWTPEKDAAFRDMRARGVTFPRIAATFGCTIKMAYAHAKALGIPPQIAVDHKARTAASHAAMLERAAYAPEKPKGYDDTTRKWALGNWKTNEEARLVAVHLGLSGDKRGRAVIETLRAAMAGQEVAA